MIYTTRDSAILAARMLGYNSVHTFGGRVPLDEWHTTWPNGYAVQIVANSRGEFGFSDVVTPESDFVGGFWPLDEAQGQSKPSKRHY